MQNIFKILIAILLLAGVACSKEKTYPTVGSRLPYFAVTMNDGSIACSDSLNEGVSLVVFFHTLCEDCQKELEILQPFYDNHKDEFPIILIARAENRSDIESYWKEHGYTMPYSPQSDRTVYDLFSDSGIPHVVLSRNGTIIGIWNNKDVFNEEEFRKCISAK